MTATPCPPAPPSGRLAALDALRAFALLLGVAYHASLAYVLPPGLWAVGTVKGSPLLSWAITYAHSFRMELFFLLAGFFAHLVIQKRGAASFAVDRARRIGLVFVLALYPMKVVLAGLWVAGGRLTGWLQLPPEVASLPTWQLALGSLSLDSWPRVNLTHLWFLYYLAWVSALALLGRALLNRIPRPAARLIGFADSRLRRGLASWFAPLALALVATGLLAAMDGPDVDTPDKSLGWNVPVLLLYGFFFGLGWLLHRQAELLPAIARRWRSWLATSVVISVASWLLLTIRWTGGEAAAAHAAALRWGGSAVYSLTMAFAVLGWLGLFVDRLAQPRPWIRYLADASYWVYLVHLPLVVAGQVVLARWDAAWWIKLPLLLGVSGVLLLGSFHLLVRTTWIGAWLNGRSLRPPVVPAPPVAIAAGPAGIT